MFWMVPGKMAPLPKNPVKVVPLFTVAFSPGLGKRHFFRHRQFPFSTGSPMIRQRLTLPFQGVRNFEDARAISKMLGGTRAYLNVSKRIPRWVHNEKNLAL